MESSRCRLGSQRSPKCSRSSTAAGWKACIRKNYRRNCVERRNCTGGAREKGLSFVPRKRASEHCNAEDESQDSFHWRLLPGRQTRSMNDRPDAPVRTFNRYSPPTGLLRPQQYSFCLTYRDSRLISRSLNRLAARHRSSGSMQPRAAPIVALSPPLSHVLAARRTVIVIDYKKATHAPDVHHSRVSDISDWMPNLGGVLHLVRPRAKTFVARRTSMKPGGPAWNRRHRVLSVLRPAV